MERRQFVERVGGLAVLAGLGSAVFTPNRRRVLPKNWTWVHGNSGKTAAQWRAAFDRLALAGINGVLVSGGEVEMLSVAAHEAGLEFHRWIWILNRPGDSFAQENHPEWFVVNRDGESSLTHPAYVDYYKWVCPTREPVRQYVNELVMGSAINPEVDGVHLDYIRHPDVILPRGLWSKYGIVQDREYPQWDYCYCEVCRETFAGLHGVDPLELPEPTEDMRWKQFRWDSITRIVNELADTVHRRDKVISAAVFPTPEMSKLMVHQQWDRWNLDMAFPMIYHSFYEQPVSWIESAVAEGVAALGERELYAGLYLPALEPPDVAEAVRGALSGGAAGVSFFEMNGLSDRHLEALGEGMRG